MLPLSSQFPPLGSNLIVWLCDRAMVKSFQKGQPLGKAKRKQWWSYLSQFRLRVHHIPAKKMDCLTKHRATTSMRLLVRALNHSPKRLCSVWMSSLTCPCRLLKSSRVGA